MVPESDQAAHNTLWRHSVPRRMPSFQNITTVISWSRSSSNSSKNLFIRFRLHVECSAELRQQQTGEVVLLLELLRKFKKSQDPLLFLEATRARTLDEEEAKCDFKRLKRKFLDVLKLSCCLTRSAYERNAECQVAQQCKCWLLSADLWGDGWTRGGRSRCRAAEEEAQVEVVLVATQDSQELQTHADQRRHGHALSWHLIQAEKKERRVLLQHGSQTHS